jgi:hypothetical protein
MHSKRDILIVDRETLNFEESLSNTSHPILIPFPKQNRPPHQQHHHQQPHQQPHQQHHHHHQQPHQQPHQHHHQQPHQQPHQQHHHHQHHPQQQQRVVGDRLNNESFL